MNIAFTGLRGSGKTSIAESLSKKTGWDFIDIDEEIEKEEGSKIQEIVEQKGWDYFRNKEKEITKRIANLDKAIISTGGGTIVDPENAKILKKNCKIIYLYVKPETCVGRILDDPNRPPLTNQESLEEEMKQLYKDRNGHYCQKSDKIFHRSNNIETDVAELKKELFD